MNKNISFLHNNEDAYISLRSIADAINLPETTVRCRLFERKVDKAEYVKGPDSFYISENAACQLLNDIDELHPEARNLERFHIWMHHAFDEMAAKSEEDPCKNCDRPNCIGCEHEDDDDSSSDLGDFLDMLLVRIADLELRMGALEKER